MKLLHYLALLATVAIAEFFSVCAGSTASEIATAEWFCNERGVEADYIKLSNKKDDHYFYWLTRSRSANANMDPLVVWLQGGPGSSSFYGLLLENGPCLVQSDLSVKRNAYAWNNNANVIWPEQPSGVGFSYFNGGKDDDSTGDDVGKNMYAFLNSFMDKHPEFIGRPLYFAGQSYAGHYIPAAAHYIWTKNKQNPSSPNRLNLQGIAIGNGCDDYPLQFKHYSAMATHNNYNLTLLTKHDIKQMNADAATCDPLLTKCVPYSKDKNTGCSAVMDSCYRAMWEPYVTAGRNLYDIRVACTTNVNCPSPGSFVGKFLNSAAVQTALAPVLHNRKWNSTGGDKVYDTFITSGDWARSYSPEVNDLLSDGLRVLSYAGDADIICSWIGNRAWTKSLEWSGKQTYNAAAEEAFTVPVDPLGHSGGGATAEKTKVAGSKWQFGNLAFVRMSEAGHDVPVSQPVASFVMIDRFLKNEPM